jgi:hypothetical protein
VNPDQDPDTRREAASVLSGVFAGLGTGGTGLGGLATQFEELLDLPLELTQIFANMSMQLTELVLKSLEQAGIVLVKALSPM